MSASSNIVHDEKANLHPGRIVLKARTQWHTPAQKKADDLRVQEVIDAQAAAIQQAHARVREMETAMEVRQVIQGTAKAKPVRRDRACHPPVATETRQAIQVAAKAKSVRPRRGPVSLQGKPGNIVVQPRGEVADMEVDTHQSQSGRTASCMLRRQGAVADLDLLANVASTRDPMKPPSRLPRRPKHQLGPPGPSLVKDVPTGLMPRSNRLPTSVPSLTSGATTAVNSNTSLAYQGKMPAPTHCMDKEELEDQRTFSVKVVASTANDIESDNEFNQLIFEEAQTGSKRKYLDLTMPTMLPHPRNCCRDGTFFYLFELYINFLESQTDNGVDEPKKSKVDRDADQESGQRSTTASQAPSTRPQGKASKCPITEAKICLLC
ncbi:hypothetical protein BKA82DRAFT_4013093 [Pisolithus tinctorius]|nr:hypothetical protein BKA82DRAFT_4013093 [Pisolithus tinctorius]